MDKEDLIEIFSDPDDWLMFSDNAAAIEWREGLTDISPTCEDMIPLENKIPTRKEYLEKILSDLKKTAKRFTF